MLTKNHPGKKTDLNKLSRCLIENITSVLDTLEIFEYQVYNDRIAFACPIHQGDNKEGACIFTAGKVTVGNWQCWTHHCEEKIVVDHKQGEEIERPLGRDIFGFIRGVLSQKLDRHVEYAEAIRWAIDFTNYDPDGVDDVSDGLLAYNSYLLNKERVVNKTSVTRDVIRNKLRIPSTNFLERGFLESTLDRYDVGLCVEQGKEMFHRIVTPFYDDDYEFMVGCMGRTLQPKCPKCEKYHYENRECPKNKIEKKWAQKWISNTGFSCHNYLYNYWFAKNTILETGLAILVEGQPDVWRLEEAGIKMGVAICGSALTDEQKMILDSSGVMNLLIATDNDKAGLEARQKIIRKCERYYNCHFIDLPTKDIGDMMVDEVHDLLDKRIEKLT